MHAAIRHLEPSANKQKCNPTEQGQEGVDDDVDAMVPSTFSYNKLG